MNNMTGFSDDQHTQPDVALPLTPGDDPNHDEGTGIFMDLDGAECLIRDDWTRHNYSGHSLLLGITENPMTLTRGNVAALIPHLLRFIATGSIKS